MALSVLARLMKRGAFEEFETGETGPRTATRMPALRGFARGTTGSLGSRTLQNRNPEAGEQEEREFMQSPIFSAFLSRMTGPR